MPISGRQRDEDEGADDRVAQPARALPRGRRQLREEPGAEHGRRTLDHDVVDDERHDGDADERRHPGEDLDDEVGDAPAGLTAGSERLACRDGLTTHARPPVVARTLLSQTCANTWTTSVITSNTSPASIRPAMLSFVVDSAKVLAMSEEIV